MRNFTVEYRPINTPANDELPPQKKHPPRRIDALFIAEKEFGFLFDREHMKLRGKPIRLNDLMKEVNMLRVARGADQILYNLLWGVPA